MKRLFVTSVASAMVVTALNLAWVYAPEAIQRYYPQGSMNYSVPAIFLLVFVLATGSLWRSSGSTLLKICGTLSVLVAVFVGTMIALLILFGGTT
jgi:hypothetical protein